MKAVSKYASYSEVINSNKAKSLGISNEPNEEQLKNLVAICTNVFDEVREYYDVPLYISSGFRSDELNKVIGGSAKSQHMSGEALDIDADVYGRITNKDVFNYIRDNLVFDQLIWEFGNDNNPEWVHVSYKRIGKNRKNILLSYMENGKVRYKEIKYV
jgi:hypothetical protein